MSIPVYFWFPVLGSLGLGFISMSAPPVADQYMSMFGVGFSGLSVFLSAVFWTHAALQVPAGLLIDRLGAFRSFLACMAICLIGSLGPLIRPDSLALAVACRLILGASTAIMFLLFMTILKILAPAHHAARAQGLQGAAFCLGTMLPYLALTRAGSAGWLAAYLSGAVFCLILGACLFRLPRAALRASRAATDAFQLRRAVTVIVNSRHFWFLGCCHGFSYGSLIAVGNWLPAILADTRADSGIEAWGVAAGAILLTGTAGRVLSGEASRLMPRRKFISRVTLCIGALYALLALAKSPLFVLLPAVALALLCGITYASILTLAIDMASPAYVATAVGFMNMLANGVNIMLILALGNAREFFGGFGPGLALAALGAAGICLWGRSIDRRTEEKALGDSPQGMDKA